MATELPQRVERFDAVERAVHWTTAALFVVLLCTAAVLYLPSAAAAVGRRAFVRDLHVTAGFLLPAPLFVALAGRRSGPLWTDVAKLSRWDTADGAWLRSLGRRPQAGPEKFNAGQKLNAAFLSGAVLVMLSTGSILHWPQPVPLRWRTGATFVHDWLAIIVAVAIAGHIAMAVTRPESLRGMLTGRVRRGWAEGHHPRWTALPATLAGTGRAVAKRTARPLFVAVAGIAVVAAASALLPLLADDEGSDGPALVARRFEGHLQRNDLERAYQLLGPAARAGDLTQERFFRSRIHQQDDRYLDPGQTEPYAKAITAFRQHRRGRSSTVAVRVSMSDGRTTWRQVDLSRIAGRWVVDRFMLLAGGDPCADPRSFRSWGCRAK